MGLRGPCRGVKAGPLPRSAVTASEALWEGAAPDRPQVAQLWLPESSRWSPCRAHSARRCHPRPGATALPRE